MQKTPKSFPQLSLGLAQLLITNTSQHHRSSFELSPLQKATPGLCQILKNVDRLNRSPKIQCIVLIVIFTMFESALASQDGLLLTYATVAVTQCILNNGPLSPTDIGVAIPEVILPSISGDPITVNIQAPSCSICGCSSCKQTITYTTAYDTLCPSGIRQQVYEVTETYSGMSEKPIVTATALPFGFTREVQACTTCGPDHVTATVTRPISNLADINGGSHPSSPPLGVQSDKANIEAQPTSHVEPQPQSVGATSVQHPTESRSVAHAGQTVSPRKYPILFLLPH